MRAVTHLEKVITGEVSAVTHLEKVIAEETSAVTYTEKVIAGEATPITHLQKVIAGIASPVTHLEQVWAGGSPTPSEHEYTGAVPVTITADGTPLLDYLISGNMEQSGTPTQQNPIMPQGTGERTGNLYNGQYMFAYIDSTGKIIENAANVLAYAEVEPNTTYTVSADLMATNGNRIAVFNATPTANLTGSNVISISQRAYLFTITTNNDTKYIAWHTNSSDNNRLSQFLLTSMLNTGSTPLPYEPYGIKIPISSANTTTPVYLGEVETTRKIRKLVLTGQETGWNRSLSGGRSFFYLDTIAPDYLRSNDITLVCSHYKAIAGVTSAGNVGEGETALFKSVGVNQRLYFRDNNYSAVDDFKAYLAAQYANGTPVTVWYVLAEPETGIVNEPLMKIGDYADTLSMEQAGVSIPTLNGQTVIDVNTTLKPSEIYIKYKG